MNANYVFLIGRLGKDPELRYTPNGAAVVNFSMAMSHYKKKSEGDGYEEETTWMDVTAWSKLAERVGEYAKKGNIVSVVGSLRNRSWEDDNQKTHHKIFVEARDIQINRQNAGIDKQPDSEPASNDTSGAPKESQPKSSKSSAKRAPSEEEDDLPF